MKKNTGSLLMLFCSIILASCGNEGNTKHEQEGYTVKVTYDLGEGTYELENAERVNVLELYYKPYSPITNFDKSTKYKFYNGSGNTALEFDDFYLDKDFTQKLDVETFRLTDKDITVYAKWINYDFDVYYIPEGKTSFEKLGYVRDKKGTSFSYKSIWPRVNELYEGYTLIGAYSDEEMTQSVVDDKTFAITADENVKNVYTKWVKGDYQFVNSVDDFVDNFGESMYINCDIDLTNKVLPYVSLSNKTILGNNHKITNLKIDTTGRDGLGNSAVGGLFRQIENSTIKDLSIEGEFTLNPTRATKMYFGVLGGTASNVTLNNVNINATYTIKNTKKEILINEGKFAYTEKDCTIIDSSVYLKETEKE